MITRPREEEKLREESYKDVAPCDNEISGKTRVGGVVYGWGESALYSRASLVPHPTVPGTVPFRL